MAGTGAPPAAAARRRRGRPPPRVLLAQLLAAAGLLATIGYALAVAQRQESLLGVTDDPQAPLSLHEALLTTFLHVALAAAAGWLFLLRRRAGFLLATILGVVGLVLFAALLTAPRDADITYTPAWLLAVGLAAAIACILGGALGLRPPGSGPIDSPEPMG